MYHNKSIEKIALKYGAELTKQGLFDTPLRYGDINMEYDAIRNRVGLYDISFLAKFKVAGRNVLDYLQKLVTRDIEYLALDRSDTYLMLDENAHIIDQVTIYNFDEHFLVECWPARAEQVEKWLEDNLMEEVSVTNVTLEISVLSLEGPYSWKVIQRIIDFDIVALPYQAFIETVIDGRKVTISRTGYTAEYGYKLFVDLAEHDWMWEKLVNQDDLVTPVGLAALDICRTEARFAQLDDEVKWNETIFEACLNWMVDFDKQGYIGYESLQNQINDVVNRLVCFQTLGSDELASGNIVTVEGIEVGEVRRSIYSPTHEAYIGVLSLYSDFAAVGIQLESNTTDGGTIKLLTVSAPIVTAKSWFIKME